MKFHPEPDDIIAYAEDPAQAPRRQEIETHLATCRSCALDISAYRNLRALEAEGLLIKPSDRADEPSAVVKQYLKHSAKPEIKRGTILTALSGALAAGLAAISPSESHSQPAFAGRADSSELNIHENNSSDIVSSAAEDLSLSVEPTVMQTDHEIHQANPVIGTPAHDANLFPGQQSYADTCAIRCQEYIIRQYTGLDLPEKFYVDEARAHGWYQPGHGTQADEIGNLLEIHNIPVHRYLDANVFNLTGELAQGHKVIVGVHADDLWSNNSLTRDIRNALGFTEGDHAVVVTGIDTHDPAHIQVIVSDPGTGEVAAHYPIEQFVSAWREAHFYMVSTQAPPPPEMHLPEMSNFDYQAGHIHHIGDLAYDQLIHLEAQHDSHAHVPGAAASHHWSEELVSRIGHHPTFEPSSEAHHPAVEASSHISTEPEHALDSSHPYHDQIDHGHHDSHGGTDSHGSDLAHGHDDFDGHDEA